MLTHIVVNNFAIVDRLALDLQRGFTVLTGETGAGKSILVDAIGFALGERADAQIVGPHGERADVSLEFDISQHPAAQSWLADHELESSGECIVRRSFTREGRSRAFINGQPVPLQSTRALGELLVDIHGQHAHQSLLKREVHSNLLDGYAGLDAQVQEMHQRFGIWQRLNDEFERLHHDAQETESRREFLTYQIQELEQLALSGDEIAHLDEQHRRLAHAEKLLRGTQQALAALDDEENAARTLLARQWSELSALCRFDPALAAATELLNSAVIALGEAIDALRHYEGALDIDPAQLAEVEQRLAAIHQMARKHRVTPAELPALLEKLHTELAELAGADARLESLPRLIEDAASAYFAQAQAISTERRRMGKRLAAEIENTIRQLGMPHAVFEVALTPVEPPKPTAYGLERVEFLVSANPGYAPSPLQKVASGGELSRVSLAIQVATANAGTIPTLVFDEVDAGIGGGVAETVGEQLHALGQSRQVLCVTHLAQVAAQGHQHMRVSKQVEDGLTRTGIEPLEGTARGEEIARMLGGRAITKQTRAHAKEMLARGQTK